MDIVEELRKCANDPQDITLGGWEAYAREAADEIESLRKISITDDEKIYDLTKEIERLQKENQTLWRIAHMFYNAMGTAKPHENNLLTMRKRIEVSDLDIAEVTGFVKPHVKRFGDGRPGGMLG